MKRLAIAVFIVCFSGLVFAKGFSITKPDAVGGNLVGMTQDKASYGKGTPLEDELIIGPGVEFFLKYDVSPRFFLTLGTGINTVNHSYKIPNFESSRTTFIPTFEVKAAYKPWSGNKFSPFLMAGLYGFGWQQTIKTDDTYTYPENRAYDGAMFIGGGAEIPINEKVTFMASGDLRFVITSDADPQPQYWAAKAGISYRLPGREGPQLKDEIEYPLGDDELASLDDLFKDSGSSGEFDDLDALFAPEEASGDMAASSGGYDDELNELFDESSDVAYSGNAQTLQNRIQKLRQEMDDGFQQIQQLESKVEENEKVIAALSGDVAGDYVGISSGQLSNQEFKVQYEQVLQKVYSKKYPEAIAGFHALMNGNPNHKLASNCQYWIGECYNALGDYSKAIQAFNTVMEYRSSYKFDDALIMTGLCSMKIGDSENARKKFQELVNRYPDSEYAPKAMRYLGRL
ncbi:tetratricopeptide repeat protein [bacterium]|nr:tetratricopeptide repeat protein [bacterium]